MTSRGARLDGDRRPVRSTSFGPARVTIRGPIEHTVVEVDGELDFASASDVLDHVQALPHAVATLDLSSLDFVDGAGARTLLDLLEDVAPDRRSAALAAAPGNVRRTIALVERARVTA